MRLSRRRVLQSLAAVSLLPNTFGAIRPAAAKDIILNDASKLNATPVAKVAIVTDHADEPLFASLRAELEEAAKNGRPVAVGGTRHSMGGQSLARGGTALAIDLPSVQVHAERRSYTVRAGTRWRDVIRALDPLRLSPVVMQSNHDFTVGGTLSVNAHGWPVPFGPFGSTVKSFRMMLADGTLMTCSREQNADLFRLAIGGYGLFGIVVDLELAAAPNWQLRAKAERMASEKFARAFVDAASDSLTAMLYGRLSVSRDDFLRDALMVAYRTEGPQPTLAHAGQPVAAYSFITRNVFRAQIGSDAGKRARWLAETQLLTKVSPLVTRNDLLNYPVARSRRQQRQPHRYPARIFRAAGTAGGFPGRLPRHHPEAQAGPAERHAALPRPRHIEHAHLRA